MTTIEGMRLGRYGIWTFDFESRPASLIRESARELEELGWPALWIPETDGREALTHAGFLLAATENLTVVNGIALCAIHHLAYDRNLMGIDPDGMVHIARRLLDEVDGPMLRTGLQGFHGAAILQPRRSDERPDPDRLEQRFAQFSAA